MIAGRQLAQTRPGNTTAATAFTASVLTEITAIFVANTTGTAATFQLFHDDDGSTYNETTALYFSVSVPANTTTKIESASIGTGILVAKDGTIGVQTGTTNALTFTLYGVPQNIARPR